MTSISKYFSGRSLGKRRPSSSSASDSCVSPDPREGRESKDKQEKKKPRQDSEVSADDNNMSLHESLEDIKNQLTNVSTKQDIQELRDDMNRITARLEMRIDQLETAMFEMRNERDVLAADVKTLREENKQLKRKIESCVNENRTVKKEMNDMEQHGRQCNLRVFGVPEKQGETVEDCVGRCTDIFTNKVGVTVHSGDIEIAHRTGKPGGPRPRPIIIRFHSRRLRGQVLTSRRKLKQSGVSIAEDLTAVNYQLMQRAKKHSATLFTWSSNGKVLVKTKQGVTVKLEMHMNVEDVLVKAMAGKDVE